MAHELAVWLFDRRIGELALHNGRLQFRYSSEWLAAADASPLSSSLPLQSDAFDDHQTRPFSAGWCGITRRWPTRRGPMRW